ncbi:MAG: CDP-alcohol phosphatidyltransferase family protein [Lysobacterales bacterium]
MLKTAAFVLADSPTRLWGLSSRERLRRQVGQIRELVWIDDLGERAPGQPVLLIHAGYLFELRTLKALLSHPDHILLCGSDGQPAAALLAAGDLDASLAYLRAGGDHPLDTITPAQLQNFDARLRRSEPPLLEPISASNREQLEATLYGNAYKGITDLVTKWLWPRPAMHGVRLCAQLGLSPNMVTGFGLALMLAASLLFLHGHYAWGLLLGWLMTYLDTVDGKLARVTVRSSRVGHALDHGMDAVHPPFWYAFWGLSLPRLDAGFGLAVEDYLVMIIAGYVVGRLIEGAFERLLACTLFAWRPFDAYFRLITARRNPCLILLSVSLLCQRPDWGFAAVAWWTALTSAVLAVRLLQGLVGRWRHGPLVSWLVDGEDARRRFPRSYRTFANTRAAYLPSA